MPNIRSAKKRVRSNARKAVLRKEYVVMLEKQMLIL